MIGIVEIEPLAAAMHDERNAELVEQRDAPVGRARRRDIDGVDLLVGDDAAVGGLLVVGVGRGEHEVEIVPARIVAEAGEEFDEMRIDVDRSACRQHIADHAGLAGRQPPRAGVRPVAVPLGRVRNAPPRLLADFRIAVQRPAHRRLRKIEHVGELFQVHGGLQNLKAL